METKKIAIDCGYPKRWEDASQQVKLYYVNPPYTYETTKKNVTSHWLLSIGEWTEHFGEETMIMACNANGDLLDIYADRSSKLPVWDCALAIEKLGYHIMGKGYGMGEHIDET